MKLGVFFKELTRVENSLKLSELDIPQKKELQKALNFSGYPVGTIDGLIGKKTFTAWSNFKKDNFLSDLDLIGKGSISLLQQKSILPEYDFSSKEKTIESIKLECDRQNLKLPTQKAYVLATTDHETAHTFLPVKEAFWESEEWRKKNLRYYCYYGRGLVQITWSDNYKKFGIILDIDLVKNPDLALNPQIALFIMVYGFKHGSFTGVRLEDFINDNETDYFNARKCINGLDCAKEISNLTSKYL